MKRMTEMQGSFVGTYLGNYRLIQSLGTGGFAEVYLGMHKHLETYAAIKVLHTQVKDDEQQSFLQEARTIARLRHPNIVRILEFGIEEEMPYLVMYYSPNGTLRQRYCRGQAVPLAQCLPHLKQVASGLQYAHDNRVIHRDVKPDNMLLGEKDEVFLSDFGIATQAHSSRSQTVEDIIGTVRYMAPEQLRGKPRPASDQYSLAIITYEWLCGQFPFDGDTYIDIARQHMMSTPQLLREQGVDVSANAERVILTALAKDSHQRYLRIQDFVDALEEALHSDRYREPASFQRSPLDIALSSSALATSVIGGSPLMAPGVVSDRVEPMVAAALSYTTELIVEQPAQKRCTRRALLGGATGIVLLGGAGLAWREMTQHSSATYTSTRKNTVHTTIPTTSSVSLPVSLLYTYQAQAAALSSVSWSPDDKYIVSTAGGNNFKNNVRVWNAMTGKDLWTKSMPSPAYVAAWAPNGRAIAIDCINYADNSVDMTDLVRVDNGQDISVLDEQQMNNNQYDEILPDGNAVAWSPDGAYLAIGCDEGIVGIWDGVDDHTADKYSVGDIQKRFTSVAWSPDGKGIISGTSGGYIYQWTVGNTAQPIYTYQMNQADVAATAWSPDGKYIAAANTAAIQLWDSDGGTSYQKNYLPFAAPFAWSPDGKYIASASSDASNLTMIIWEAQTGKVVTTGKGHTASITTLAWSKQGDMLASGSQDKTVCVWSFKA